MTYLRDSWATQHAAELALRVATATVQTGHKVIQDGIVLQPGAVFSIDSANKSKLSASGDAT